MNRFAIDENTSSEILGIFELDKTFFNFSWLEDKFNQEREQKGMDHYIMLIKYRIDRLYGLKLIHLRIE